MNRYIPICVLALLIGCACRVDGHPSSSVASANEEFATLHQRINQAIESIKSDLKEQDILDDGYTPSATPLLLLSPEMSVWSMSDSLSDPIEGHTRHWSGGNMTMVGAIRVDGAVYQFLGDSNEFQTNLTQTSKMVLPTSTYYNFLTPEKVELQILFTSIVDDINNETELYRPYGYVTISVNNTDPSTSHLVSLYYDLLCDWSINTDFESDPNIGWESMNFEDPTKWVVNMMRNYDNIPFSVKGDFVKTNWGRLIHASKADTRLVHSISDASSNRLAFASGSLTLPSDDLSKVRNFKDRPVSSALQWNFGTLTSNQATGAFMLIGLDEEWSINYFGEWQRPLWSHYWSNDLQAMIEDGLQTWSSLLNRCLDFDTSLWSKLKSSGGVEYAILTSLAYRQVTGGIKGVWSSKLNESRWYMKEISSDGDVSTVDVIYPASPFFLQFGPEILRRMLLPLLDYAINATDIPYNLPWAPHHLGIWPVCDITSGQQEQMPMEESGNLLLMLAGIVKYQSDSSLDWLSPYWSILDTWSQYLISSLPDPGNQLCTDDFEGPSPHNVNLALKGILGLGAYSELLKLDGQVSKAEEVQQAAEGFVQQWLNLSYDEEGGNHTQLEYGLKGSYSMKYNMLFQYILGLNLFPTSVMSAEFNFYQSQLRPWGLPLDSRGTLTKSDWSSWIAAMSDDATFSTKLFQYLLKFAFETPSRGIPFSDWYDAESGAVLGFRARPVQGGLFAKLLLTEGGYNNNRDDDDQEDQETTKIELVESTLLTIE